MPSLDASVIIKQQQFDQQLQTFKVRLRSFEDSLGIGVPDLTDELDDLESLVTDFKDRVDPGISGVEGQYASVGPAGIIWHREPFLDVSHPRFGAVDDGVTNSRSAIQSAIDAALATGVKVVRIPRRDTGVYRVEITGSVDSHPHCLTIDGDDLTLQLDDGVVLDCYTLGGDPDTNWPLDAGGAVWRGGGIFVTGGAAYATRRRNVVIEGGEIRGNYTYTGDHDFPANPATGDGWDITHKGVWYEGDLYHDNHAVRNCHIWGFSGEVIYSGGRDDGLEPELGWFEVTRCHIHETNGSAISMGGRWIAITYNHIHTTAGAGIENVHWDGHEEIAYNWVHDTDLPGIGIRHYNDGLASAEIHQNLIERAGLAGLEQGLDLVSMQHTQAHHNLLIDCGIDQRIGGAGTANTITRNVDVTDNIVLAHSKTFNNGIQAAPNGVGVAENIRVHRNHIGQTKAAKDAAFVVNFPILGTTVEWSKVDLSDNTFIGLHGTTANAKCQSLLLTATSQTTVASRKSEAAALYRVSITCEVMVAATNVTINLSNKGIADATLRTLSILALTSLAVGTYFFPDVIIPVKARHELLLRVTAGTANQVTVHAVIREA